MGFFSSLTAAAPMKLPALGAPPNYADIGRTSSTGLGLPNRVTGTIPNYPYATPGSSFATTNPDYKKLLGGDSLLTTGLSGLGFDITGKLTGTGQASVLQNALTNARRAALENFGGVPNFSSSQQTAAGFSPSDIDATTRSLAEQNSNSILAQLSRHFQSANSSSVSDLAARGMLHSGALGAHENHNLANYNQQSYDAGQTLLSQLAGLQGDYQTSLQGLQSQRQGLVSDALSRIISGINADQYGAYSNANTGPAAAPARPASPFTPYGSPAQVRRQAA